jgi:peptide/nickel transport system substrate-binding protein
LFAGSLFIAILCVIIILSKINNHFMVEVPMNGGTITEGIISVPTLINPVLAISDADKDLTNLIYSGLMRKNPDGTFILDLAESYEVSSDQLIYKFILKKDLTFHDGSTLTVDDLIFTINQVKNPLIKSPYQAKWASVLVEKIDEQTVIFTLKQPYPSFIENTTLGILPMKIWENLTQAEFMLSGLNIKAIGSGPYKIDSITKNKDGIPNSYTLKRFKNFILGTPRIKYIKIISYSNEKDLIQALLSNKISQAGSLSPENAEVLEKAGFNIHTAVLPRMFGLFFNGTQNKIFTDKAVINAFNKALNREEIINKVLFGYGSAIDNPVPKNLVDPELANIEIKSSSEEAKEILDKAGWTLKENGIRSKGGTSVVSKTTKVKGKTVTKKVTVSNGPLIELSFSLSTGDDIELNQVANIIKEELEAIGARVEVKNYETGTLNQLIRERKFEGLFFGQVVNHESDLYAFWHSSQKNDPGLNIALYNNSTVDNLLESAQKNLDSKERVKKYSQFVKEFRKDMPALFIYSPEYLYATKKRLSNLSFNTITIPSDRFNLAHTWYTNSDHVWKIFNK